jgi:hypothetical protein
MATGKWPSTRQLGCGLENPIPSQQRNPIPLGRLGSFYQKEMLQSAIVRCVAHFEDPCKDGEYEIEKFRTAFTLLQSEAVFCINFIPKNPFELQILHVMRLQEKQDPSEFLVFCHDHVFKYILPVEQADQVFDLSRFEITQTFENLKPSLIPIVEKALGYFFKDSRSKGLALTLESKTGTPATYIWLK